MTRAPGYLIEAGAHDVDADRFGRLVAGAAAAGEPVRPLDEALALWRGRAYGEFAGTGVARFEAIRLEEARLAAFEQRAAALLDGDRAAQALPALEAFVSEHPLGEGVRALHMRALYALGRQADALAAYQAYRSQLAGELGLEPSAALQRLQLEILRQEAPGPAPAPLADLEVRYLRGPGGRRLAWSTMGDGPPLVALPADRGTAAGYLAATYEADVADLLHAVTAPALILHYNRDRVVPFAGGRQLAEALPDARLLAFDGPYHLPDAADLDRIVQTIADFLDEP